MIRRGYDIPPMTESENGWLSSCSQLKEYQYPMSGTEFIIEDCKIGKEQEYKHIVTKQHMVTQAQQVGDRELHYGILLEI